MQPRQRKCVLPEKKSIHFMKAILPSPIHLTQIRIPDEFIIRFGNELKNVATISVPDSRCWKMGLEKCSNGVFFCGKWQEFVEYYSIEYGCYLTFKYEGNSNFSVVIFDVTSVEICYPSKTPSTNGETNTKCPSIRKTSKVAKKLKNMSHFSSERAEDASNEFNPKNPSFRSKCNRNLYVPSEFASKYLKLNVPIKLQNSQGEQWEVYCRCHSHSQAMRISSGFTKFGRDNNLSKGDICVFELIQKEPVVLKVTMQLTMAISNLCISPIRSR